MERPIHDMLRAVSGRRSMHMPGHKGRDPFGPEDLFALDTTELPCTDDLYSPAGAIARAETLWARAGEAGASLLMTGGSTAGVHVLLQLWAAEGDTVILPRNAHLSAVSACVLGGLRVRWIPLRQTADGYAYAAEEDVLGAIGDCPQAKTLLLTRPDYSGGCIPLERIVREAHRHGIRVAVDEAHGAHLPFAPEGFPLPAARYGADGWTQSVHKTLPGLTGSAVLHLRDTADAGRARAILRREQSSSPSFLLLRSADDARAWMEDFGRERFRALAAAADTLRRTLPRLGYRDAQAGWGATGYAFDPTRLVIGAPQGGEALAQALAAQGVDVEAHDSRRAVLILSAADTPGDIVDLRACLARIPAEECPLPDPPPQEDLPPCVMTPREAAMGRSVWLSPAEAEGRVAAAAVGLYPPGIPLCVPGERLGARTLSLLVQAGPGGRFGMEGDRLLCVDA